MQRRTYLQSSTAAMGGLLIAGCLDDDETANGDEANGEAGNGDEENGEDQEDSRDDATIAAEHIDDADRNLEQAISTFEDELDAVDSIEDGHFDISLIQSYIDDGESDLDEAAEYASQDQRDEIDARRDLITFLREFVAVFESVDAGVEDIETADSYIDAERFSDAIDRADSAHSHFQDASSSAEAAQDAYADVDRDVLESLSDINPNELQSAIDEMQTIVDSMVPLADGFASLISGLELFLDGLEHFEREEWHSSYERIEDSEDEFADAVTAFRDGEEIAPGDIRDDFIEFTCAAENFETAAGHWAAAARAAEDGDWDRADEESQLGNEALESDCEIGI